MNKEESLELMKHLILQLRDNEKALRENPRLMQDWVAKQEHLKSEIDKLNSCDAVWLNDQYMAWFKKEIEPHVSNLLASLPKQS